jgi:hypothetical protein
MANQIRPKGKLEKYIDSLVKKTPGCEVSTGTKSRYYKVNGKVLRVSDHVGTHSDAYVSIIEPAHKEENGQYILHAHNCGQISIVNYDKVKEIVRSFFYLSSIFGELSVKRPDVNGNGEEHEEQKNINKLLKQLEELEKFKEQARAKGNTILGIPVNKFSKAHIDHIQAIINKMEREGKL